jgi:beta-galactosidase
LEAIMQSFQRSFGLLLLLVLPLTVGACSLVPSGGKADLAPTLGLQDEPGGLVAFQSGQPVPTFDWQPRLRADLDGAWRFEPETLNSALSFSDRRSSLKAITSDVGPRAGQLYDDSGWSTTNVPGTFNPPPSRETIGGYYRRTFFVPALWSSKYALLKFGAVRYVADVWLNGEYLGYHEGGDTPFALDATGALVPGGYNSLLVRVDNPEWGTRDDIVPWGLADWWNYGGIVGDVWLEATPPLSAVRADVTPHLDGADVSIVVQRRGEGSTTGVVDVRLWPAQVTEQNRLNPDARSLIPPDAEALLEHRIDLGTVSGEAVFRVEAPFAIRSADLWSPGLPALYVLQVTVVGTDQPVDDLYTSFGLRQVRVDSGAPRILLNGAPVAFNGVAMHEEMQSPPKDGRPAGGPVTSPSEIAGKLQRAMALHADLVRVDHHPPNPMVPVLADRLGIAIWEEIPLYHYTPQTFSIAIDRGIPQQMLAEMDLRDFNRPSVLFHGFSNESTGGPERQRALDTLHALDRKIDGTRLTGQAAYGTEPTDRTSANLDVAGYTIYYGVLYGGRLSGAVLEKALLDAHRTYPRKPIMVLEYGHWADNAGDENQQVRVFNAYYSQLEPNFGSHAGGFVGAALWWTLDDYWTQRPGLEVETFGLYNPNGKLRKAGVVAQRAWARTAPATPPAPVTSTGVAIAIQPSERHSRLLTYFAYGFALPALMLIAVIFVLSRARRPGW